MKNYDNAIIYIVIAAFIFLFFMAGGCSEKKINNPQNAGSNITDTPVIEERTTQDIYNQFKPLFAKYYYLSNSEQMDEYHITSINFTNLVDETANFDELNANNLFTLTTVLHLGGQYPQIDTYSLEYIEADNQFRANRNGEYMHFGINKYNQLFVKMQDNTILKLMTFSEVQ